MSGKVERELEQLRDEICRHDRLYYVDDKPAISDEAYDKLFARLKKLEDEHPGLVTPDSPTQRLGDRPLETFTHVAHAVPMLSIDNTYNETELREFDARVRKGLGGESVEYLVDPKIDGVSVTLRYQSGRLVLGATRGDGRQGDDITANIRTIRSIPLALSGKGWPDVLEVRGEAYWPRASFDKFNAAAQKKGEEPFANPRNATSGTLKLLDSRIVAPRGLSFCAHGNGQIRPDPFDRASDFFDALDGWGVPTNPARKLLRSIDDVLKFVAEWDKQRRRLSYETDGLVIKVNRYDQRDALGATSRFPRWCIAYKYAAEQAETLLEDVVFQVGKLGTITPVAVLRPTPLSGTTVKNASLHNFDQIERLGVRIGDAVIIEKAGEIIPQVVKVLTDKRGKGKTRPIRPPAKCPVCKGEVLRDEDGVYYRCINPDCEAQLKERLRYFCGRDQMDIEGAGEALIDQLVDSGLVRQYADLFKLRDRREKLIDLERMGEKSADNLLDGIEKSKKQPLSRLLAGLNIRHVGQASAELLAARFERMDKLAAASAEDLQEVEGIGPEIASSIRRYFESDSGRRAWESLRDAGVNMTQPKRRVSGDQPLAGKTVVVTGTLEKYSRSEIQKLIRDLGGSPAGSVSKKTDFVVAGDDPGGKLDKARELGVTVLDEAAFLKLIGK